MRVTHLLTLREIADSSAGLELWGEPKRLVVAIIEAAVHLADAHVSATEAGEDGDVVALGDAQAEAALHLETLIAAVKAARENIPRDAFE